MATKYLKLTEIKMSAKSIENWYQNTFLGKYNFAILPAQVNTNMSVTSLPITFDKSHLVTLGEKLYQEGVELIRELVCNSYDADAANVWIEASPYQIKIKDDGSGMDLSGLRQYLTIGSEEKKLNNISPVFGRERIGQFGIGKFAVLSASELFKITTQKGDFAVKLTFDEKLWKELDTWDVPIHNLEADSSRGNGTTVILERLKKEFSLPQIEKAIRERTPLKAPHFPVFLNGRQIEPYKIPGRQFPVHEETDFGSIHGEIIIPHFTQKIQDTGIEITVRGVLIKRENFAMELTNYSLASRITGHIEAGFLPVTSDRGRFIIDSEPYLQFEEAMKKILKKIIRLIRDEQQEKADKKADKVLRNALRSIRKALRKNQTFAPLTFTPTGEPDTGSLSGNSYSGASDKTPIPDSLVSDHNQDREHQGLKNMEKEKEDAIPVKKVRVRNNKGQEIVARKIKIGSMDVVCTFENLGDEAPEYLNESGVIIINQSHRMYKRVEKREDILQEYILRLISQELAKQYYTYDSNKAFDLMNQLLRDAVL